MAKETQKIKRVCKCENCGNEAEMLITCTLDGVHTHEMEPAGKKTSGTSKSKGRVKGKGVCASCGNEADMWVDL